MFIRVYPCLSVALIPWPALHCAIRLFVTRLTGAIALVLTLGTTAIAQALAVRLDGQVFRVVN